MAWYIFGWGDKNINNFDYWKLILKVVIWGTIIGVIIVFVNGLL